MIPLIECVPNFSEGRDATTLAALASAVAAVPGVQLLDVHADPVHHRSVFTFCGTEDAVADAALAAAAVAVARIDLTRHQGVHPRFGAVDVIPFVPLFGTSIETCVALAHRIGERMHDELGIPAYFYARAARRSERIRLRDVRRSGFEELSVEIETDPAREPDVGPPRVHPTAGTVAVGARPFLVAFNVELRTVDLALGKRIAREIRESAGGLAGVQALAFPIDGGVQVSTNIVDVDAASPARVFDAVAARATKHSVEVVRSEIVGLAPEAALADADAERMKLDVPLASRALEPRIRAVWGRDDALAAIAAATPSPGGGAAAARAGALAAALAGMTSRIAARRAPEGADRWRQAAEHADALRGRLLALADADAEALRRNDTEAAIRVPLDVACAAADVAALCRDAAQHGHPPARPDAFVGLRLAAAAAAAAADTVRVNAGSNAQATREAQQAASKAGAGL